MKLTIKSRTFFAAFAAADHGGKAFFVKLDNGQKVKQCAWAWLSAHGKALRLDTQAVSYGSAIRFSYAADADIAEEGEAVLDLEDLRDAVKKLKKCKLKNELVEIRSERYLGSKAVVVTYGGARVQMNCVPASREGLLRLCATSCGYITPKEIDAMAGSLSSIKPRGKGEGIIYGASAGIVNGSALITDGFTADLIALPRARDIETAVPRIAIAALRKTGLGAELSADGAISGPLSVAWRLCDTDPALHFAKSFKNVMRGLVDAKPVTFSGASLRRGLRELSAFCTRGDTIRMLPHSDGAKLLRYDCKDTGESVSDRTPCAETVCEAAWPLRRPITLSSKALSNALGDADEIEILAGAEHLSLVAVRAPNTPVMRVITERKSAFDNRENI